MTSKVKALSYLRRADPSLFAATKHVHHTLPLVLSTKRTRKALFNALAETIVSQQLSVKAADTIYMRVKGVCHGAVTPQAIREAAQHDLRSAGLSAAKTRALQAAAGAVDNGRLDLLDLKKLSADEAAEKLKEIWGIGSWTAEMFLLFGLGHPDVFSPGDLGLVRAMERLYSLPQGSNQAVYLTIAEKWSPHRSFASLLLWRYRDAPTLLPPLSRPRR